MKLKTHYFAFIFIAFAFSTGCNNSDNSDTTNENKEQDTTSTKENIDNSAADTIAEKEEVIDTISEQYEDPEVQEAHKEIVKKYGTQWDFCTCVRKNDSVNSAMLADGVSDKKMDALFERSAQIDEKCKGLLIQPNATPEDRAKHEVKVKKCLDD